MTEGSIANIMHASFQDGEGIRTVVFLSGCNLRCFWCHNPESWYVKPQVLFYENLCSSCGNCVGQCGEKLHWFSDDGRHHFKRSGCTGCGRCARACFFGALDMSAIQMSSMEVLAEIKKDVAFYNRSNGGVTLSGGDPFYQCNFVYEILKGCRDSKINTIVQTALHTTRPSIDMLCPLTDTFYIDIKHVDDEAHIKAAGVDVTTILRNITYLDQLQKAMVIRIPVIPGFNDTLEVIGKMADFVNPLSSVKHVELLPFHASASTKYSALGLGYDAKKLTPPTKEQLSQFAKLFRTSSQKPIRSAD